jgi:hypothetical protein
VTRNNPLFLLSAILAAAFFPFASATTALAATYQLSVQLAGISRKA